MTDTSTQDQEQLREACGAARLCLRAGHDRRMLALAEQNRVSAGIENVKFLKGQIEQIPLMDRQIE